MRFSVRGTAPSSRSKMATSSTDRRHFQRAATTFASATEWSRFAPRVSRRLLLRRLALQLEHPLHLAIDRGASLGEDVRVAGERRIGYFERIRNARRILETRSRERHGDREVDDP